MTQPKKERRERAAKRLVAQLEAGTKPEKIKLTVTRVPGRHGWMTSRTTKVPLTEADRKRIHAELVELQD